MSCAHPDFRIARRALILSRLAQVISERKVQGGLRRVLLAQKRLQWLSARRSLARQFVPLYGILFHHLERQPRLL